MVNAYYLRPQLWEREIYTTGYERDRLISAVELIPPDTRTLLDVGCGNGAFLSFVERMRPGISVSGVEASQTAIDKKLCVAAIQSGDVTALPFPDRSFDLVCSMAVLEHIPAGQLQRATDEIARVARRGILVNLPLNERRVRIRCPECGCGFDPHLHLRSYSDIDIRQLFPGCSIVERKVLRGNESLLPYVLLRVLGAELSASRFPNAVCPQCNHHSGVNGGVPTAPRQGKGPLRRLWEMQPSIAVTREVTVLFSPVIHAPAVPALRCPSCGSKIHAAAGHGACAECAIRYEASGNCVTWESRRFDHKAARRSAILRSLFDPLANPYSPIVRLERRVIEGYYERTLSDRALANKFRDYYLRGIDVDAGATALDHGCGRGRVVGLLHQLGVRTFGQDMRRHPWWRHFPNSVFQTVSPEYHWLPWESDQFDIVFDFEVLEYLTDEDLGRLASEVSRTLKQGGSWIVRSHNPTGRGAHAIQAPFIRSADATAQIGRQARFDVVSLRYDDVAYRVLPRFFGVLKTIRRAESFDYFAYDSLDRHKVPDAEKSKYTIVFRKPAR